jgi:hypothetical protein
MQNVVPSMEGKPSAVISPSADRPDPRGGGFLLGEKQGAGYADGFFLR